MDYKNNPTPPPYMGGFGTSVASQTNAVLKKVYLRMFIGLIISGVCALGVASSPAAMSLLFGNPIFRWGLPIAMIAMAIMMPVRMMKMSTGALLGMFALYSAMMGAFLAPIFLVYKMGTIAYTFFVSAGTFGAMSVYGYFTKKDLTKMGSFLVMALIGLVIASLVNMFVKSSGFNFVISILGVIIFIGLTAWDTQSIKRLAAANLDPALQDKLATMGAMNLYLDFVNIFLYLLQIFGGNNRD